MADMSLLAELERVLPAGSKEERARMLARMADLYVLGSDNYSPEQVNLFDELLTKLISVVEADARRRLAERLAGLPNEPAQALRALAFDDDIAVAGSALRLAGTLHDADLITNATTKSQQHLLAISGRKLLSESVTDVLVTRGDNEVVHSVAQNAGANFSFLGFNLLVRRAADDSALATIVGARPDLPRKHLLTLLDRASADVRARLAAQNPAAAQAVMRAVEEAKESVRSDLHIVTVDYAAARSKIEGLRRARQLDERSVLAFVRENKFEETVASLAVLCDVDIEVAERAMLAHEHDMVLILAKLAGFSWASAKQIMLSQTSGRGMGPHDLNVAMSMFGRLNIGTARQMLDFHNSRALAARPAGVAALRNRLKAG
jgi:uncharacterized protein (DUF2336 family)